MHREYSQLKAGVMLSYINLAIGSIIPIAYTPTMLRLLGQAEYGLYSLSGSIIAYLSLLNFGMGSTIVRYVTKYRVENKKHQEQASIGLFLEIYTAMAVLVAVGGIILCVCTPNFFSKGLAGVEIKKLQVLILIMSVNTAVSFPSSVFSSVIIAHERYVFSRCMDILGTIIVPVVNIIMLYLGFGSVGMAGASVAIQLLVLLASLIFCLKKIDVKPSFEKPDASLLKEIAGFSAYVFLSSIVDVLFWSTDKVILGSLVGPVAVAIYNVGATFNSIVERLSTTISSVLTPRITRLVVLGADKKALTDLLVRIGRLQFLIIGLIISGFITFGKPFVVLWAGEEYEESYVIALLTMVPLSIPLIQTVGKNIVVAQSKHQFRAVVYLIIAVINAASTYFIVPYMGGIGAALCSAVSYIIGQGIIMNIYYQKVTGLDMIAFWKNILHMITVPLLLVLIFKGFINRMVDFYCWKAFLPGVMMYTGLYSLLMYFTQLNAYEKELVWKPIRSVSQIIKK